MSVAIEINQKQINNENKLQLHFLPAKIDGDGSANVDIYFNNYTRKEDGFLTNALRGYPLQGEELKTPDGFRALVLQESQSFSGEEDRCLRVSGTFDKFTYWNYDKAPSKADAYTQSLKWSGLAAELSKPISESDVLAEMELHKNDTTKKGNEH